MGWRLLRSFLINSMLAAVPPASYIAFNPHPDWSVVPSYFWYSLVYANSVGFLAMAVFSCTGAWFFRFPPWQRWPLILVALTAVAAVGTVVGTLIIAASGELKGSFGEALLHAGKMCFVITMAFGIGSFLFAEYRGKLEETTLALRTRELEKERAEKLIGEARLSSLESRIHPHFLFNALNSVSALIRENPELAEKQVERISRFLRFSLDRSMSRTVAVWEEMKIVTDYLEIEKTRFGERLRYSISIAGPASTQQIPPFSIQTLVENSLKYAVAPRREGGQVRISAWMQEDKLHVEVWDNGPGFQPDLRATGHGLDLLESRLNAQFGDAARLQFQNGEGMRVGLEIPCALS